MTKANFFDRSIDSALKRITRIGNRLPHPSLLFIWLSIIVIALSWLLASIDTKATHPITQQVFAVNSLANAVGLQRILAEAVTNFTHFAPVGVVLVVMLGIGVAEHSGLIGCALKRLIRKTSPQALAYIIAFAGVMSSLGADVGYVVLIPIAGMIFHAANRPALVGIAVAFAGVSAGYSANLFVGPVDVMLAGISTEAAHLANNSIDVSATDNYYFILVSTLLITVICGWLSNHIIEPRLSHDSTQEKPSQNKPTKNIANNPLASNTFVSQTIQNNSADSRALVHTGWFTVIFIIALLCMTIPSNGALYSSTLNSSPVLKGLIPLLAGYFALAGYIFGRSSKRYSSASQAISGMESAMSTMAYYIVLMFFAAQFVSYFSWSNIGIVTAINGANWLGNSELSPSTLLLGIIIFSALINLFVGSASAKWTLLAPIFVPMLMLLNIPPEQTQLAYRIGDSSTNIITPLMPYFGIVLAYAQKYKPQLGLGDIVAMMLPYSLTLLVSWSAMLAIWISLGLPLGP